VGLFEGRFRANLEETDLGYDKEVEMIRIASELDMVTTPYSFNPKESIEMTKAGADIIVAHVGCTVGGTIGANSVLTLDDAVKVVQDIHDAAVATNPDVIVLCHGGPIAEPKDAEYVLQHTKGVHGFYGASSAERLPVETALRNHISTFKAIKF
jgi:predicted TIM-barrel enzyme